MDLTEKVTCCKAYPPGGTDSWASLEFEGIHFRVTPGGVLVSGSYQYTSTRRKGVHILAIASFFVLDGGYTEARGGMLCSRSL